jgi:hypothetical protein
MSWFKDKRAVTGTAVSRDHADHKKHHQTPHVAQDVEVRLAAFLVTHERLQARSGRPLMHLLGVSHNAHDGTTDYSIRSRVKDVQGHDRRFDSTVRMYPSGHLRLVR